ncbi:MAG: FHIPEP family type III secretion protein, partial [Brevundimonas sp.]
MRFANPLNFFNPRASGRGLGQFSDLFLVAGVAAIIAMIIMPLPSLAIDTLVAINISAGVVLLLVSIYIASIVEISVFPSLLLITTLFRLALSIATTRMILLEGH